MGAAQHLQPPGQQQREESCSLHAIDGISGPMTASTATCSYSNAAEAAALAAACALCAPSAPWADKEARLQQLATIHHQHAAEAAEALLCAGVPAVLDACLAIMASGRTSMQSKLLAADLLAALCCDAKCRMLIAPSSIVERLLGLRAQQNSESSSSRDGAARALWQLVCQGDFLNQVISQAGGQGTVLQLLAKDLQASSSACIAALQAVLSLAATASKHSASGACGSSSGSCGSSGSGTRGNSSSNSAACGSSGCSIDNTACESMGAALIQLLTLLLDAAQPQAAALAAEAVALLSGCALNRRRLVAAGGLAALSALLQLGHESCCAAALRAMHELVAGDATVAAPPLLVTVVPAVLQLLGLPQCTEVALLLLADLAGLQEGRRALVAANGLGRLAAFVEDQPQHQQAVVRILSQATNQQQLQRHGYDLDKEASAGLVSSEPLLRSLVSCLSAPGHTPQQHAVKVLVWTLQQAQQQQQRRQQQHLMQGCDSSGPLLQLQRRLLRMGCLPQLTGLLCNTSTSSHLQHQALEFLLLLSTCPELLHAAAEPPSRDLQSYSLIIDIGSASSGGGVAAAHNARGLDVCVPALLADLQRLLQQQQQQQQQTRLLPVASAPPLPQHEQQQHHPHKHSLTPLPSAPLLQQQRQVEEEGSVQMKVLQLLGTMCHACDLQTAGKLVDVLVQQQWVQVLWQFLPHEQHQLDALLTQHQVPDSAATSTSKTSVHYALEVLPCICARQDGVEQLLALHRRRLAAATAVANRRSSSSNCSSARVEAHASSASNARGASISGSSNSSSSSSSPGASSPISHSRFLALLGGRQHSLKGTKADSLQPRDQTFAKGSSSKESSGRGSSTTAGANARLADSAQQTSVHAAEQVSDLTNADLDSICIVGCSPPADVHAMFRTLSTSQHSLPGGSVSGDPDHTAVVATAQAALAAADAADAAAGSAPAAASATTAAAAVHVEVTGQSSTPTAAATAPAPAAAAAAAVLISHQWSVPHTLIGLLPLPWATTPASCLLAHMANADAAAAGYMLQEGLAEVLAGCLSVHSSNTEGRNNSMAETSNNRANANDIPTSTSTATASSLSINIDSSSSSSSSSSRGSTLALLKLVQVLASSHARDLHTAGVTTHVLHLLRVQGTDADMGSAGPVVLEALAAVEQLACARERAINAAVAQAALLQLASALAAGALMGKEECASPQTSSSSSMGASGSSSRAGGSSSSGSGSGSSGSGCSGKRSLLGMAASALQALLDTGAVDHAVAESLDAGAVAKLLGSCVLCLPLPPAHEQGEQQLSSTRSLPGGKGSTSAAAIATLPLSHASSSSYPTSSSPYPSPGAEQQLSMATHAAGTATGAAEAAATAGAATRAPAAAAGAAAGAPAAAAGTAFLAPFIATRLLNALVPLHPRFSDALVKIQGIARLVALVGGASTPLQLRLEALGALDHLALRHRDEVVTSRAVPAVVGVLRLQPSAALADVAAAGAGAAVTNPLMDMHSAAAAQPHSHRSVTSGVTHSPTHPVTPAEAEAQLLLGAKIRACNLITVLAFNNDVKRQLFHAEAVRPLMALAQCKPALPALKGALSQLGLVYLLPPQ